MKRGAVLTVLIAILGIGAVFAAFLSNASPYVTVAQAREHSRDGLKLAGDLDPRTVSLDIRTGSLSFMLTDANGERVRVVHKGDPPANMGDATKVVATGRMVGEEFHSTGKLLIKCPTRYESEKTAVARN
jgi:cytochrome c-type biogenesis protein CcmE